jgi:uncharacterized repeat protein (TIGR01451 family)
VLGLACVLATAAPGADDGPSWVITRRTLPGGGPGASVIDLEQALPSEVRQGQPFDYRLRVANCADCPVAEVAVVQRLPSGVSLLGSHPQAEIRDGVATWRLGTMAVRESRLIQARAVSQDTGPLTFCCDTLYRAPLCVTVASTRPELLLSLDVPVEGTPCDMLPVQLSVRNTGTGQCRDVRLQYQIPEGLTGPDDRRVYAYQVGTLPPGEARGTQIPVRPLRTGTFQHRAVALSADGLRSDAVAETRVVAPLLTVALTGTEQQFAGRDVVFTFSVRNAGDAVARNLQVEDVLPPGVRVVGMKPEAVYVAGSERVVWRLAALPANASVDFALTVKADKAGSLANRVIARADCAQDADASYTSRIKGVPAILLEVVDLDDPIEVGSRETYVITATNQGTAPCTNLVVRCLLEDTMQYASSDGPTAAVVSGLEVAFGPLAILEPKEVAVWKLTCDALRAGDVRFRVLLTADQLTRPVEETEATHLY